uniref:Uncharacterized protein n=1 Tax=Populus alba TaxID=43335 RepID=A0A4U5QUY5_POPAL|nr:hypothetical protein D5086_0000038560 [Populus alba]
MELRSTKNKIHAIQEWPTLKNVGEVADVPVLEGLGVEEKGVAFWSGQKETWHLWLKRDCGFSVAVAVEETEREEEAAEGKAFGGEVGRRLLRLNMRGNDIFRAAVGTMTVGLWGGGNREGRSREGDGGRDQSTLVARQTKNRQLWRGRVDLVSKG